MCREEELEGRDRGKPTSSFGCQSIYQSSSGLRSLIYFCVAKELKPRELPPRFAHQSSTVFCVFCSTSWSRERELLDPAGLLRALSSPVLTTSWDGDGPAPRGSRSQRLCPLLHGEGQSRRPKQFL